MDDSSRKGFNLDDRREVVVKIDQHSGDDGGTGAGNCSGRIGGKPRYEFRNDGGGNDGSDALSSDIGGDNGAKEPPFSASGNQEVEEKDGGFNQEVGPAAAAEVLRCTSDASFRKTSTSPWTKTRSRLTDPVAPAARAEACRSSDRSGQLRSGQLRSGLVGRTMVAEEDEDPFLDEDLPPEDDGFKSAKLQPLSALQWASLILNLAALGALAVPAVRRRSLWGLRLWKWIVLVLVLICGRLVSGWGIRAAVFFIERNFLLRKRVLYFVYGVRKPVQNCLWLGLVLVAWQILFDQSVERKTHTKVLTIGSKVLVCLLITTFLCLAKTLLIKSLASSFHVSTYFDRIREALFNQYVIETLSGPPLIAIQQVKDEEDEFFSEVERLQNAGVQIPSYFREATLQKELQRANSKQSAKAASRKENPRQQEAITIEHLNRLNHKNVSAWNMKRLIRIVRHGTLSTLDEKMAQAGEEDEFATQIRNEQEAKVAARKIFYNVAKPGAKFIELGDLLRFLKEDEAEKTMNLFEGAEGKKTVTKRGLKNWVVNVFKERRALSLTLNDTKTAVNKLHQMANIVVALIVLAVCSLVLGLTSTNFFVFISSQLLLVTFVFGNTLKMLFEAIIFLFVMHPFDVGDRCEIDGNQMIVEEMNILTTIFLRYDNQKITYPNSVLATMPIGNIYRSPDMGDSIDFCIHVSTPREKVALMKERLITFIEKQKEHWYPNPTVMIKDVEDMNKMKVAIWLRHRMNFQDIGEKWIRRELVVQEMIRVLRELDIEYRMLPVDVNLRSMPGLASARMSSTWKTCS